MENLKIFDASVVIKNSLDYRDVTEDLLDLLDGMLNEHNVPHCIMLPGPADIKKADDDLKEAVVELCYMKKDRDVFALVYMLWMVYNRGASHVKLMKAMAKFIEKGVEV